MAISIGLVITDMQPVVASAAAATIQSRLARQTVFDRKRIGLGDGRGLNRKPAQGFGSSAADREKRHGREVCMVVKLTDCALDLQET